MSEIKRGANVAGTVPATGPAAIRTTALLPGNRTSNMTVGSGPGSGTNRTGVGIGGNNLSRIANSHLSGDSSPSVSAENVHMDESKSPDGDTVPSSSTPSNQILKSIASSIKSISGAVPIRMTNNVSHANHLSQPSDLNEITSNTGVLSSAVHESQIEDIVNNEDESPNKKRLRLDVNAANAVRDNLQLNSKEVRRHRISGESLLDRRKRIHEHRKSRLQRLHKSYSQNATEHYFIQNHVPPGSFVDLQAFRKKPNLPFLNYLKANKAPSDFLQEVALAVLGHNNSLESIGEDSNGSGSNAGKTYKNHSPNSIKNETNIQTLTVKLPSSKPSFQQGVSNQNDENSPFYPLHFCGRVTSAAMAQAIHLARKNRNLQSPQVHPFSNQDYGSISHLSKATNSIISQDSLPASQPSKFPPYLPKILSASEMGGVMYGPKLESFPPSTGSTLNLPTVPIAASYNDLQSRISGNGIASQPQSITSSAPAQLTTLFKSTLPRYPREQFYEKCRQEPFVVRTIAHLSREGLWSQKRLPKVCERPRPRTHWDSILSEMQWMAVDYHQERKWKKAAAKILAYSAKEYVEQWEERKRLKTEQRERNSRAIAKFVSGEILKFWQSMRSLHYDQHRNLISSKSYNQIDSDCVPINSIEQKDLNTSDTSSTRMLLSNVDELHSRKMLKRRRNNSNGSNCTSIVYNELTLDQDLDKEDDVELFELAESDMNASDDELTIEEQENFENENTIIDRRLEWDTLLADNQKAVDDLLKTNYSAYWAALNDNSLDDLNTYEDSSGVEDGGSDSDDESIGDAVEDNENEFDIKSSEIFSHQDFDLEAVEKVIHVPLSSKQRFLYDDYMAGPDVHKALEGDGQTLSIVLNNLRKICNHPGLVFDNDIYSVTNEPTFSLVFPRVIDHQYWHPKFLHAIEYDPWKQIDLSSLNMVYFDHEFTLTAITSDRIRKCCASRKLIEELSSSKNSVPADNVAHNTNIKKASAFGPPVPSNRLKLEIHPTTNPQHSHISSIAGNMQSSSSSVLFNQSSRLSSNPQNQQRDQQLVQTINGQHMFYTSTIIKKEPDTINDEIKASSDDENNTEMKENIVGKKIQHHAFHKDSLHVIARFNERRCNGMPLFGRDLVEALTVVDSVRPIKSSKGSSQNHMKRSGQGYVNCLNAGMNDLTCIARPRKRSKAVKEDPEYRYQTNALKKLITSVTSSYQIHSEWCNSMIRIPAPVLLTCVNWNSPLHRQYTRRVLPSLQKVTSDKDSLMLEEMLNDVEAISQLDWLWSNKLKENRTSTSSLNNVVEMAQVELNNVDGCDNTFEEDYLLQNKLMESQSKPLNIKPIERYALSFFARTENEDELDILDDKFQDLSPSLKFRSPALNSAGTRESIYDEEYKLQWELQYQSQLAELEAEQEHLDSLPFIIYSTEDGGRTSSKNWFGRDGQPMPLWSPPMPSTMHPSYLMQLQDPSGSELTSNYFSYLYDTIRLMDENELPPVYVKKELAPMHNKLEPMLGTNLHGLSSSGDIPGLNQIDYKKGIRNENYGSIGGLIPGPTYAPRSLFDRPVNPQKVRPKVPRPHPQSGVGRDGLPKQVPSLPFHPLPRPQVEAESAPDWLVAEDWALLTAVRDLLELPLNLQATSPAHTPNWDMIADMVNSVSHVYRGPRQCRNRYETIVVPREEGRILFDLSSIAPPDLSQMGTPTSKKKKKQDKKSLPQPTPKPNRPIKTATLFKQDDNRAWTQMFGNRFGSIKAVAMKRAPTTKPLVVNPVPKNSKHAQVLSESGISYDAPLNPISVAANRAERIQKEKQRTQQDQQQQRITAAQQVASAVQRQAATQGTAAVAVQQHPPGTVVTPGGPRVAVASLPLQQQQQTTVVQASATLGQQPSGQAPQAVVVGISQPITSVTNNQHVVQQTSPHPSVLQTGRNLQPIGVQERILVSQQTQQQSQSPNQPQQSTVVVSGQHQQPSTVGTVINLPPSAAQKIVGQSSVVTSRAAAGGLVSFAGRQLTPQQFNALKQQALLKKSQQQEAQNAAAIAKARLQSLQPAQLPQVTAVTLSSASGSQVQAATAPTIMGQATTSTGQKVSVAVAPGGGVSLANVANAVSASGNIVVTSTMTGAVTVVTQAMTSGQPKAHLIRQVNSLGKGTVRTFSDSEMKLLVQKQQQLNQQQQQSGQTAKAQIQLPTHVTSSTGQTAITAQFLAQHGIQVQQTPGGPSVATLVKTTTAGTSSSGNLPTQSVTIPVAAGAMNLPQIRAALSRSGVTNPQQVQMLQKQLLQRKQLQQGGIAIGQGAKGLPAQLIVSSGGNPVSGVTAQKTGLPQSVTVQQIQQIVKSGQVVSAAPPSSANATVVSQGQILPHSAILTAKAGSSPATVQARVIPVSSGALNATPNTVQPGNNIGRTQQIQVVAASPNQAVNAALSAVRQVGVAPGAAPNVTVDASGRPTSGTGSANTTTTQFANAYAAAAAAGGSPTIRIQGGNGQQQQQIISQVSAALAASSSGGHPVSVAVRGPTASVLAAAQQAAQQGSGSVPTVATSTAKSQTGSSSTVTNASSVSASPSTQAEGKS